MIRLGLCCLFSKEPITFRRTTAAFLSSKKRPDQLARLSELCAHNAASLMDALSFCHAHDIGAFRVNSQIFPLKTHPELGYDLDDLPGASLIRTRLDACRVFAATRDIRLTLHPDQFVLLSSPHDEVTRKSLDELIYQAEFAELAGADVINLHGGGAYGDKPAALDRLRKTVDTLDDRVRSRLTLENDDRVYTPADLLPVCRDLKIPLVYDVHHHRCLPDGLSEEEATDLALETWGREPLFHLSSPLGTWTSAQPRKHDDFIDIRDFPSCWRNLDLTVDVEAKAKEIAVLRLARDLTAS
ncbi:UV DNA damage repair endonuclease UvsE [Desulfatiferula olefinivorans]